MMLVELLTNMKQGGMFISWQVVTDCDCASLHSPPPSPLMSPPWSDSDSDHELEGDGVTVIFPPAVTVTAQ